MWLLEYHAILEKERSYAEIAHVLLKNTIVNTMGLNSLRPEDDNGIPKKFEEYTEEDKKQFIPLIYWMHNKELIKNAVEQASIDNIAASTDADPEYQEMIRQMDMGDMEPIISVPPIAPIDGKHHYPTINGDTEDK